MKIICMLVLIIISLGECLSAKNSKPNVVIIFLDDSGFNDFRPFGNLGYPTPNVENLIKTGVRCDQFYVPQAICSASRAALLSGCYPGRTKVFSAHGPNGRGLDPRYETIAEMLKKNGYATAHFGKWHCGDQKDTRPLVRGFNEHAGLMYSNDMWKNHPVNPKHWGKHPLKYWENGKIKIKDISPNDQKNLTKWSTEYSVDFMERNKDKPFFLYLAHSMPHVPLFCSDGFKGKSGKGLYGDVVMELDWSVGQVKKKLKEIGVEKDTIVIFSSDNGPWLVYGDHAGTTPYRASKATSFDGGTRSATIFSYPAKLKGGVTLDRAICSIDMLPTIAHLTGSALPNNEIDGKNVWQLISGVKEATNPHQYYAFSAGSSLEAIVSGDGRWKLHSPHQYFSVILDGKGGLPGKAKREFVDWSLFDLKNDPEEKVNVIANHVKVATEIRRQFRFHQSQFYQNKK